MGLSFKIKSSLKQAWRFVYHSILAMFRGIAPELFRNIKLNVISWFERSEIAQNQEILSKILHEEQSKQTYRVIVIFPPGLDWDVQLFQRPQQLALALAKQGGLVFYVQPQLNSEQQPFHLLHERLYLCRVNVDTFKKLASPLVYLLTWNSFFAPRFTRPIILYDYLDDINTFYGDIKQIRKGHQFLLHNASYVLATARKLYNEVRLRRADVILSPNGVVYEHFARAARHEYPDPPADLQPILARSQPVIGYYGALARWFDYDLLKSVALLRPEYQFVLIGPNYDGTIELAGLPQKSNIHWLGVKPYNDLPSYLQYFDVATIPFIINEITHATSPLKLFEYMAGEKPIVITPMEESMHYPGVLVGQEAGEFARQLDVALEKREDEAYLSLLRHTAQENTWERRAEEILSAVGKKQ